MYQKEEEVQEDPRISGPTPFLKKKGYQPNRKKKKKTNRFCSHST
jgi:hypothetical protein